MLWYTIFLRKQVFSMKYIFIVSWNSCFNYLASRTYISLKTGAVKSNNNTAKTKELFLKLWYPVFDTHLTARLTTSSEKDSKYEVMFLNWSLAIITLIGLAFTGINFCRSLQLFWDFFKNFSIFADQILVIFFFQNGKMKG